MGSLKSPIITYLNCLVFQKIAFLHFGDRQTDKQTDEQIDSTDALSHSRCRERRLNKSVTEAGEQRSTEASGDGAERETLAERHDTLRRRQRHRSVVWSVFILSLVG